MKEKFPKGSRECVVTVTDDNPEGFKNLSHAFTIFAESEKKGDATKRGRFNLGEKLVLAMARGAVISTTKGTITFDKKGRRESSEKTKNGSSFDASFAMTAEEYKEVIAALRTLIPPENIVTTLSASDNITHIKEVLKVRKPVREFEEYLQTEVAGADGYLKKLSRKTTIRVFEPESGEIPSLYELGIPVVPTDDRWHIDIGQKVPLNMDRDNVPPSFLKEVRTLVVNQMVDLLTEKDANQTWVREATSNPKCSDEAIAKALDLRFGEKRVVYDPSDPEANSLAVSQGYTVISGRMLNSVEWSNVKRASAALPAGQVTPSPKPFSEYGEQLKTLPREKWTEDIVRVVDYAKMLAENILKKNISVVIANDSGWGFNGAYGGGTLTLNVNRLGYAWFEKGNGANINKLLIHEYGHHFCSDHLSADYHRALCRLGGELVEFFIRNPTKYTL